MDDTDQIDPGMADQSGSMYASQAQQAHAAAMSSFMSALDAQRDHAAMAAYRTQALQPGTHMAGGPGAAGSMARAAFIGGPRAMLISAMRHPPRLNMMGHGKTGMGQGAPLPGSSAGEKAAAFLHGLSQLKAAQRLGQGERPVGPPQGAAVHSMDPTTSAHL